LFLKFVLIPSVAYQEHERQNFSVKNIIRLISNANDEILLVMNERTEENVIREALHKNPLALKNGPAFADDQLKNLF